MVWDLCQWKVLCEVGNSDPFEQGLLVQSDGRGVIFLIFRVFPRCLVFRHHDDNFSNFFVLAWFHLTCWMCIALRLPICVVLLHCDLIGIVGMSFDWDWTPQDSPILVSNWPTVLAISVVIRHCFILRCIEILFSRSKRSRTLSSDSRLLYVLLRLDIVSDSLRLGYGFEPLHGFVKVIRHAVHQVDQLRVLLVVEHVFVELFVFFHLVIQHALLLSLAGDGTDCLTDQLLDSDWNILVNKVLHGLELV